MGAVVKHRGDVTGYLSQRVLADDCEDDACRAYVLLCTAVDEVILGDVYRAGHDVGGHVGNEGAGNVKVLMNLCAVDGVVGGDVQIVKVCRDFEALGNISVVLVLGAGDGY